MALFKKKDNVLDLTKWQESGLLERSRRIAEADDPLVKESKTIDLTDSSASVSTKDSSSFGFLADLAGAGSSSQSSSSSTQHSDFQGLKYKLEDLEYKLERLQERLNKLEETNNK